jgi:hypothetical protein
MLADYSLTLQEFSMANEVTLGEIHRVVLNFLQNRNDAIVFGAQAVNLYVDEPRMTQDVDVMSTIAAELAELIRSEVHQKLNIATRVRSVSNERGFRVDQLRSPSNRHLVDVRQVDELLPSRSIEGILVVEPEELVVLKLFSLASRPNTPKGMTDRADLLRLLLAFPEYRSNSVKIHSLLEKREAPDEVMAIWESVISSEIQPDSDDY